MSLRALTADDVDRLKAVSGRECADCSLCCKLAAIPEIDKPANKWCRHCKPGDGCLIYLTRPDTCAAFACDWLTDLHVPDFWRPVKSHMVLTRVMSRGQIVLRVMVDSNYSDAWKDEPYRSHLVQLAQKGFLERRFVVHVLVGRRAWAVQPNGEFQALSDNYTE